MACHQIAKGRWTNLTSSDDVRPITLSSTLCKLLDAIVLTKANNNHLVTIDLHFSFKAGSSTTLCSSMIRKPYLII